MDTPQQQEAGYTGVRWGLRAIRWGLLGTFLVWLLSIAFVMVALGTGWDLGSVFKASLLSDLCLTLYGLGMLAQFSGPANGPSKNPLILHVLTLLAQRALWHAVTFNTLKLAAAVSLVLALINVVSFFRHFAGLAEFFDRKPAQADFQFAILSLLRTAGIMLLGGFGIAICLPFSTGPIVWILLLTTVLSCVYGIPGLLRFCEGLDFLSAHLYRHQSDIVLPAPSSLNYQKETEVKPKADQTPLGSARSLLRQRQLPEAEKFARIAVDESQGASRTEAVRLLASILKEQERYTESADLLKEFETPRPASASLQKATPQLPEPESYLHVVTLPGIGQVGFLDAGFSHDGRCWQGGKWQSSNTLPGGASASFVPQKSQIDWLEIFRSLCQLPQVSKRFARQVALAGLLCESRGASPAWGPTLLAECQFPTSDGTSISVEELRRQPLPSLTNDLPVRDRAVLVDMVDVHLLSRHKVTLQPHPAQCFLLDWSSCAAKFVSVELRPTQILLELLLDQTTGAFRVLQTAGYDTAELMRACCAGLEKPAPPPRALTNELKAVWEQATRLAGPRRCLASEHLLLSLSLTANEAQALLSLPLRDSMTACVEMERLRDLETLEQLCSRPCLLLLVHRSMSLLRAGKLESALAAWAQADAYRQEDPALYLFADGWVRDAAGDAAGSLASLQESFQLRADLDVGLGIAAQLFWSDQPEKAREFFANLCQTHPHEPMTRMVAQALLEEDPHKAIELCGRALGNPHAPLGAYEARGRAYAKLGQTAEARADLEHFLNLVPGYLDLQLAKRRQQARELVG